MEDIYLIIPRKVSNSFDEIVKIATEDYQPAIINTIKDLPDLRNKKIIFAIELDECGFNIPLFEILLKLRERGKYSLLGSRAVIIIQSSMEKENLSGEDIEELHVENGTVVDCRGGVFL